MAEPGSAPPVSYDPATAYGGFGIEVDRLEQQARLAWAEESRILEGLGLRDGMAVLDAGCGSGAGLARLRELLPGSPITGVDANGELLALARDRFDGDPHTVVRLGDLHGLGPVSAGLAPFDFAYARFVFQHLADPTGAAAAIRDVLRPGARLAVCDVDAVLWGAAVPDFEGLSAQAYRRLGEVQSQAGGDRLVVRRLPRILRAAGFTDVVVRPYAYTTDEVGLAAVAPHVSPDRLLPLTVRGELPIAEYARAQLAWERFRQVDGLIMLVGFIVSGRRPPA
jgi:ubiquinone/menaquinone biosynthesis C-methylase UbiE